MKPLRIAIIDDEPLARENLRLILKAHSSCEVCGEATTAAQGAALIAREHPDLVLLDIEMPGLSGIDLAAWLHERDRPVIIFVTAHANHAIRAFDVGAVDYLLKPFDEHRLAVALDRATQRIERRDHDLLSHQLGSLSQQLRGASAPVPMARIAIREDSRVHYLDPAHISHVSADGNHVRFHATERVYTIRRSLNAVERDLPPDDFVRVHRGIIVNVTYVRELRPFLHGDYLLMLRNGMQVRLSRRRRAAIARLVPPRR